jgi:beta-glucanase (GH16 family)
MKKFLSLLFFVQYCLVSAQSGQGFSYQSTIRNSSNQLITNQYVKHRFTIRQNSNSGTIVYKETQNPLTNSSGNISVIIGTGTAETGNFAQINWTQDTYYMGIEYFSGTSCNWIDVSMNTGGQLVSYCNQLYIWSACQQPVLNLVWSDEFNGTGAINSSKWFQQTQLLNVVSWHNGEIQHYTNQQTNAFENNGALNIVAKKETYTDQGQTKQYTSARLNSKFAFKYGRVEVRAKLPSGAGTWPAIWMLGANIEGTGSVGWPACGEIDIMEHTGKEQGAISFSAHSKLLNWTLGTQKTYKTNIDNVDAFHVYSIDWTKDMIKFYVDGVLYYNVPNDGRGVDAYPFVAPEFLLLNLAVGGNFAGNTIDDSIFPIRMEVDYVRVYQ